MPADPTGTITFNYNNGSPQWSIDNDPLKVPQGSHTLIWMLSGSSTSGASFADANGIAFDKGGNGWLGTQPVKNGNIYRSTETNNVTTATRYGYSVRVTYTPPGGSPQTFVWDPEVENEPPDM